MFKSPTISLLAKKISRPLRLRWGGTREARVDFGEDQVVKWVGHNTQTPPLLLSQLQNKATC